MDPFTFGMVAIGASGGTLCLLSVFKDHINETAVNLALHITKYGAILWLVKQLKDTFL